ncbi:MAG TPA: GAF domain-containing protein [Actinomycetota bacterium]
MEDQRVQTEGRGDGELSALYRIAALSTHGDIGLVINEVLRVIGEVIPCDRPALLLYDDDAEELTMYSSTFDQAERFPLHEPSVVRRIFHTGIAEAINDLSADADSNPSIRASLGARQAVLAPLSVGDNRLGVVAAINSQRGSFTDADLRLLTVLADRTALTIENTQLVATLQRQVQELDGLHRLSRLLTSESVDHVIGEAIRIVSELLSCEKMAVLLTADDDEDTLVAHEPVFGITDEQIPLMTVSLREPSLVASVFRTNTPLVSNEAADDAWVSGPARHELGIENVLVVPLATGPRPIGVLQAINAKKGGFDDQDLRFTTLLGNRLASVIESSLARARERALMQRLREADRTKSEFVSMLAHELSGPMTTIQGFGRSLSQDWESIEPAKRTHILDILTKETDRLARLVKDLLDVSRMEAGTLRYELEPTSLKEIVDGLLTVHTSLKARHLVIAEVADDLPPIRADKDRLRQVLINLLTNATRYSPEGTTIRVAAELVDADDGESFVRVCVHDEGIGIAPDDIDRVFSKFSMLPKPAWAKKGTGLGLFITKGIVEAHGGYMWVDSEPGHGSEFYFTLPVAA